MVDSYDVKLRLRISSALSWSNTWAPLALITSKNKQNFIRKNAFNKSPIFMTLGYRRWNIECHIS